MPTIAAFPLKLIAAPPFHEHPSLLTSSMGCRRRVCQVGAHAPVTLLW
jgi:hypothetical protein